MILAYNRRIGNEEIIVVFNRSDYPQSVMVPVKITRILKIYFPEARNHLKVLITELKSAPEPLTAVVLKRNRNVILYNL